MPHLVYLKDIHPESFLLFTTDGEAFRLKDYFALHGRKPLVVTPGGMPRELPGKVSCDECSKILKVAIASLGKKVKCSCGNILIAEWHEEPALWTASKIEKEAKKPGNRYFRVAQHDVSDYAYWHEKTLEMNSRFLQRPVLPESDLSPSTLPEPVEVPSAWSKGKSWFFGAIGAIVVTVAGGLALAFAKNWFGL